MTPKELARHLSDIARAHGWSVALVAEDDYEGAVIGTPAFIHDLLGDVDTFTPKPDSPLVN